jgi:nanoRNase/pAp phosphatase (c-di-AMP/oligoRNAs hydrolase)
MVTELTRSRLAALEAVVHAPGKSGGRWLVLTHDNPDPDSLASAALLARLLRRGFGQRVTIGYGGLIGRAENREMVKILHLTLSRWRHLNLKQYSRFALVDAQPATGNHQLPDVLVPDLVFDHHPLRRATQAVPFADVRTDYGATATILGEYLAAVGLAPSRAQTTALIYAIRTETQDFRREAAGPDRALYDELLPRADKRALARIQSAPLPVTYYRALHQALESLETVGSLVVSHLAAVEQPDMVPEIADLLLRMEGKTWALATGLFEGRIYLSIRTSNPRGEAGARMRRLIGPRGKGGGHGTTAGGWVAVPPEMRDDPRPLQRRLAARLARALRKDPRRLAPIPVGARAAEQPPATLAVAKV